MGRSYGGSATVLMLAIAPELFKVGVAIAAPVNLLTQWERTRMAWVRLRVKLCGPPGPNAELYRRRSPVTYAETVRSPLLLVHGEDDPAPPSAQAKEMAAELERLGKAYEWIACNTWKPASART